MEEAFRNSERDPRVRRNIRGKIWNEEAWKNRVYLTAVQFEAAREFLPSIWDISHRLTRLLGFVTEVTQTEVSSGLQRVARFYASSMKPEMAVMCRSVMRVALRDRLPEPHMKEVASCPPTGE